MDISFWDKIPDLIKQVGVEKSLIVIAFVGGHWWLYHLYNARLMDRQEEINRLAEDNRDYRDRFTKFIEKRLNLPKTKQQKRLDRGK